MNSRVMFAWIITFWYKINGTFMKSRVMFAWIITFWFARCAVNYFTIAGPLPPSRAHLLVYWYLRSSSMLVTAASFTERFPWWNTNHRDERPPWRQTTPLLRLLFEEPYLSDITVMVDWTLKISYLSMIFLLLLLIFCCCCCLFVLFPPLRKRTSYPKTPLCLGPLLLHLYCSRNWGGSNALHNPNNGMLILRASSRT